MTPPKGWTQRPYRLGDTVQEKGQLGPSEFLVTWKVIEHASPTRIVLECQTPPATITYTFRPCDGGVQYSRSLEYDETSLHAVAPNPRAIEEFMHRQSEEALGRLKALVEKILREEETKLA
ncbi:MAG TPA: hypothetical protein VKP69_18670 [Isosphaeraceae bacterium]|nr:hypothetical protein [Isosphaeraceae bacterium]